MLSKVKVMNSDIFAGVAGRMGGKPRYFMMHNDAGAMDYSDYDRWLRSRKANGQASLGFTHYYITRNGILRATPTYDRTWSSGNAKYNNWSISYEVCQQINKNITDELFIENENMTLRQMAEDMLFYGVEPNNQTIVFHNEVCSTSCPARSLALHGGTNNSLRAYVINKIKYYQSLGSTVQEMIDNEKGTAQRQIGWIKSGDSDWWYQTQSGYKKNEWFKYGGDYWYYFDNSGWMARNKWLEIGGNWYYFGNGGVMFRNRWMKTENGWYWFNDSGAMVKDTILTIKGEKFIFGGDGLCIMNGIEPDERGNFNI